MENNKNIEDSIFDNLKVDFKTDKEQIWADMEEKILLKRQPEKFHINNWIKYSVAASVLLLITFSIIYINSNKKIICDRGQKIEHILPDGSKVILNADSYIQYSTWLWRFNRRLDFEGEAYFEVIKGSKFKVLSSKGETEVLGTSFNINSRNNYKVYCNTGKVRVIYKASDKETIISKGELAEFDNGEIKKIENLDNQNIINWINNSFVFNSEKLNLVFEEIERQYNIRIEFEKNTLSNLKYSGLFNKTNNVDSTLSLVCIPFDFKFEKISDNLYKINKQ